MCIRDSQGADHSSNLPDHIDAMLEGEGRGRDGNGPRNDDGGMPERKHEPHGDRTFSLLHQLPGDIVDGGDVVGIDSVPKPQTISEKCGAEKLSLIHIFR